MTGRPPRRAPIPSLVVVRSAARGHRAHPPWEGGTGLHQALGGSSAFVGVDNGGHYVYDEGSACADKATVGFLTTGDLPGKNVYCTDVKRKR
ncbi:alpha/beta hydrolase [Streptomyces sp. NPDC048385]|uniref:alpha/beta hydrolase n=1 Tax=unclassified Streptomyces TaxID=2593676 RepID=UPI003412A20D